MSESLLYAIPMSEQEPFNNLTKPNNELVGWIPNTPENVPKDPIRKLIQLDNGWILVGYWDGENWYAVPDDGEELGFDEVEAWCECPAPYQPKEDK